MAGDAPTSEALGVGHRLADAPSDLLARTAFQHELDAAPYLWWGMAMADLAHAIALDDAGLIPDEHRGPLFDALLETTQLELDDIELDPAVGDVYNNRDLILRRSAGESAGFLHAGRARREASTIAWQLACREATISLGESLIGVISVVCDVAARHTGTVMPDFTYLHRAQPTTLGHYLLGHAGPLTRHGERIERALALVDSSPAGSGSTNGSRLPIDRTSLASLLGFGSVLRHTRDAMWASDMALDLVGVCVQIMTSIDRLVEELQLWTSEAFGFVEIPDALSRTSVVMPHKKNPYSLTYLRGAARHAVGTATGIAATQLTASGQPDNRTFAYLDVPRLLRTTCDALDLLSAVLAGTEFDTAAMREAASGFTTSTEICDQLVLQQGMSNRDAHNLVGLAVRRATEEGRRDLQASDLGAAARDVGVALHLDAAAIARLLEPAEAIESRVTFGGAAVDEVLDMIQDHRTSARDLAGHLAGHSSRGYADRLVAAARVRSESAISREDSTTS